MSDNPMREIPEAKIIRIEFHLEDGTFKYLDGKDYEDWNERVGGAYGLQQIRGSYKEQPFPFKEGVQSVQSAWVSVKERLPESPLQNVLAKNMESDYRSIAHYRRKGQASAHDMWIRSDDYNAVTFPVTHWLDENLILPPK